MQNNFIITSPQELQKLIYDAVNVAVQQISLPQKVDPLPEYLNIQQASVFLNLAQQTIYGKVSTRTIPFIKKGGKLMFQKSKLETWLLEGTKNSINEYQNNVKRSKKVNYVL